MHPDAGRRNRAPGHQIADHAVGNEFEVKLVRNLPFETRERIRHNVARFHNGQLPLPVDCISQSTAQAVCRRDDWHCGKYVPEDLARTDRRSRSRGRDLPPPSHHVDILGCVLCRISGLRRRHLY